MSADDFSEEQKRYLQGSVAGSGIATQIPTFAATLGLPPTNGRPPHGGEATPAGPEAIHRMAQDRFIAEGRLLGTNVETGEEMREGYHIFIGGGYGEAQALAHQIYPNIAATDAPAVVEKMPRAFTEHRISKEESFQDFTKRYSTEDLLHLFELQAVPA